MRKLILLVIFTLFFMLIGCHGGSLTESTKTLTLAVFQSESQLSGSKLIQWVNSYNETHSDVKIEVINYLNHYENSSEAIKQIKIEIVAGKGPDMINFGGQYSPLDASSGMLADLYPFMQNDELFDKQNYYFNIIDSFAIGDSLYVLVPSYRINSFATTNSKLTGLEKMNINQLADAYHGLDDDSILYPGETKKDVFGMICYTTMEDYIDWDKGTCNFNSDSFKEILRFSNQFPLTLTISDDYSAMTFFTEGRALLYPASINNVYAATKIRTLYGKTPAYIGYPLDSGNGNMADIVDIAIGISSTSKNKEEAWEFLSSLLESRFQDDTQNGLPVRISSLEQQFTKAMSAEYNSNGEMIVKERLVFDGEDPVNIYEISKEDAETIKSIIRKVEFNVMPDPTLFSIMLEEADYYFNDNRNVDDVADIIQNRASIYVSESR